MKDNNTMKGNTEMKDSTAVNLGSAVHYELGVPLETFIISQLKAGN